MITPYAALPTALIDELRGSGLDPDRIYFDIVTALHEDLPGEAVDATSVATISADATGRADFNAREAGVLAGLGVAALVFHVVMGDTVTITDRVADGTHVTPGTRVMTVSGPTRGLLTAERTALNFASHLSGVATATSTGSQRWRAPARRCSTPARRCPTGAPSRSTPSGAAAASTTASGWPTWRW